MFADRVEGGRALAKELSHLAGRDDVVIAALPRGGVPVAAEVAEALGVTLDVIVVRKLGIPFQPEVAMGAIGEGGIRILDQETVTLARVTAKEVEAVEARERVELDRRADTYRQGRPRTNLSGRTVVIVDDGIATGSTAKAACGVARANGATEVVLAVPVAPADWVDRLAGFADDFVAVETPRRFRAVGQFYRRFGQTTDDEVISLLRAHVDRGVDTDRDLPSIPTDSDVEIDAAGVVLSGRLTVPTDPRGIVIFVHGSGSSRHSPRNQWVAHHMNESGLATLLCDLLTSAEEVDRSNVFDIELLAGRLAGVTAWVRRREELSRLPYGLFGASTGAAAALWAASEADCSPDAIVSRGGRPDLAGPRLSRVDAPTLLIVGGRDEGVLDLNQQAQRELGCVNRLVVIPGATHLFEEPGALAAAAAAATSWFHHHLGERH